MDKIRGVSAGGEGAVYDGGEVDRGPGGLFRVLDYDGVACEQGRNDRA